MCLKKETPNCPYYQCFVLGQSGMCDTCEHRLHEIHIKRNSKIALIVSAGMFLGSTFLLF